MRNGFRSALHRILPAASIALLGLAVAVPAAAVCCGFQRTNTYYSSSSHTTEVGQCTTYCDTTVSCWGTVTSFTTATATCCAKCTDPPAPIPPKGPGDPGDGGEAAPATPFGHGASTLCSMDAPAALPWSMPAQTER